MLYYGIKFPDGDSHESVIGHIELLQDQIVFYKGLYGIPSYVVWYSASDKKTASLMTGNIFEFFIFDAPRKATRHKYEYAKPHIIDTMVIINITFDVEIEMFRITAVSHFWYILSNTKLLTAIDVGTQDNPVSGIEVIKKLVLIANKKQHMQAGVSSRGSTPRIKYISINEDPGVSVLDKIADICLENAWEWYIGKGNIEGKRENVIHIANKLIVKGGYVFPFEPEEGHKQKIEDSLYTTITTESVWCTPMLSYGEPPRGRAIWVKYFLGQASLMTVVMQKFGWYSKDANGKDIYNGSFRFLTENEFIGTLDTGLAKEYGIRRLFKYPIYNYPILIGKMFGKLTDENRNEYTAPQWSGDATIRTRDINKKIFKTKFTDKDRRPQHYLKDRKITTPFAGDGVGLLFPQVDGHKTTLAPDGKRDAALIGPGYFGPGDEVPKRTSEKDFRLQFPNNGMMYYKESDGSFTIAGNKIFLTIGQAPPDDYETPNEAALYIADGTATLYGNGWSTKINLSTSEITIQGGNIKIDGGSIDINGVTIMKGGIIKCNMLTTSGGVVPPNVV